MLKLRTPSPAMAVALAALIVALAGTAWAAVQLPKNSVGSKEIKRGAVKGSELRRGAVGAAKLRDGAVGPDALASGAVGAGALAHGAVGGAELQQGAVGTNALGDDAVTASKLAAAAVGQKSLASGSVTDSKLAPTLLDAIENPTARFGIPRSFSTSQTSPGGCGSSTGGTLQAGDFHQLVFFSYTAERTAATGIASYTVERPGEDVTFDISGPGSEAGEEFFILAPGESAPLGIEIDNNGCSGDGGTLSAEYLPLELERRPEPPGGGVGH